MQLIKSIRLKLGRTPQLRLASLLFIYFYMPCFSFHQEQAEGSSVPALSIQRATNGSSECRTARLLGDDKTKCVQDNWAKGT